MDSTYPQQPIQPSGQQPSGASAPPWPHLLPGAPAPQGEGHRRRAEEPLGWRRAMISPVRYVGAALLVVIAAAHLLVVEDQFDRALYLGILFTLIAAGSSGCWSGSPPRWPWPSS